VVFDLNKRVFLLERELERNQGLVDDQRRIPEQFPLFSGALFEDFLPLGLIQQRDFFDARVRFHATDRFRLGADARFYDNSGTFGIERDDLRAYFEFDVCENYLVNLAYRTVDYDEKDFNFDDYDADIIEVSVGLRF